MTFPLPLAPYARTSDGPTDALASAVAATPGVYDGSRQSAIPGLITCDE